MCSLGDGGVEQAHEVLHETQRANLVAVRAEAPRHALQILDAIRRLGLEQQMAKDVAQELLGHLDRAVGHRTQHEAHVVLADRQLRLERRVVHVELLVVPHLVHLAVDQAIALKARQLISNGARELVARRVVPQQLRLLVVARNHLEQQLPVLLQLSNVRFVTSAQPRLLLHRFRWNLRVAFTQVRE